MNDGVKILLERMKTNPEEFLHEGGVHRTKWGQLIDGYKERLDPEDAKALTDGYNALLQQQFTEKVMEELIDPKKSKLEQLLDRTKGTQQAGATQGAYTLNSNGGVVSWNAREPLAASLTLGNTTINEDHVKHMKAHLEALSKEVKESPKTLFGRLFNYQ